MDLIRASVPDTFLTHTKTLFDWLATQIRFQGLEEAVKRWKSMRNAFTRFMAGKPIRSAPDIKLSKTGIPAKLKFMASAVTESDTRTLQICLSILVITRCFEADPKMSLDTIIPEGRHTQEMSKVFDDKTIQRFLDHVLPNKQDLSVPKWKKFHLSSKNGPMGKAGLYSMEEISELPEELIPDLKTLGGEDFSLEFDRLKALYEPEVRQHFNKVLGLKTIRSGEAVIRRLRAIPAPECKTREIAIFDYWSQTVLLPLHDFSMKILKRIKDDFTFNNHNIFDHLDRQEEDSYHSLDLTAATDRLPVWLQECLIRNLFGEAYASSWRRVLTGHEFVVENTTQRVQYGAGQPMGAYSSWTSMALTHHLIIFVARERAKVKYREGIYGILGDDCVICEDSVAQEYIYLMNELGVDTSPLKSHVSQFCFEFAKVWWWRGSNISPISVSAFIEVADLPYGVAEYKRQCAERGWTCGMVDEVLIRSLYSRCKVKRRWRAYLNANIMCQKLWELLNAAYTKHTWAEFAHEHLGYVGASGVTNRLPEVWNMVIRKRFYDMRKSLDYETGNMIGYLSDSASEIDMTAWRRKLARKWFWQTAHPLIISMTSVSKECSEAIDLRYNLPLVYIWDLDVIRDLHDNYTKLNLASFWHANRKVARVAIKNETERRFISMSRQFLEGDESQRKVLLSFEERVGDVQNVSGARTPSSETRDEVVGFAYESE